jgi:hypothetical protein
MLFTTSFSKRLREYQNGRLPPEQKKGHRRLANDCHF